MAGLSPARKGNDPSGLDRTAAVVINFNTADLTTICIQSILRIGITRILVLDNGSSIEDRNALRTFVASQGSHVFLICSSINLGFAAGSNLLIGEILNDPSVDFVLLLNSDALAQEEGIMNMVNLISTTRCGLVGGRVVQQAGDPCSKDNQVHLIDSLGITLYRPLLASNRKSTKEAYLGPTAGCAIYSRLFLETVIKAHGYIFDSSYFCYAEDTDLCLRARLIGYEAGYVDEVAASHVGQASSGGRHNSFIFYHGIRNSLWMLGKTMPLAMILASFPWVVMLHVGIFMSQLLQGNGTVVWKTYRDAFLGIRRVLSERHRVQRSRTISVQSLRHVITPRFYAKGYITATLSQAAISLWSQLRTLMRWD